MEPNQVNVPKKGESHARCVELGAHERQYEPPMLGITSDYTLAWTADGALFSNADVCVF